MQESANGIGDLAHRLARIRCIKSVPDGPVRYELRLIDCRSVRCKKCASGTDGRRQPTHGPYWYMLARRPDNRHRLTLYIGKTLDTSKYRTKEGKYDHEAYLQSRRSKKTPSRSSSHAPRTD